MLKIRQQTKIQANISECLPGTKGLARALLLRTPRMLSAALRSLSSVVCAQRGTGADHFQRPANQGSLPSLRVMAMDFKPRKTASTSFTCQLESWSRPLNLEPHVRQKNQNCEDTSGESPVGLDGMPECFFLGERGAFSPD